MNNLLWLVVVLVAALLLNESNVVGLNRSRFGRQARLTTRVRATLEELIEKGTNKQIVVEIVRVKPASAQVVRKEEPVKVVGAYTVYKEQQQTERVVNLVTDSPMVKMLGFVFNPTSLLLVMYFSSIGWSQVLWLQKFFKIFGRGTLTKKKGDEGYVTPVEELPFQTFECEKCGMEMRPARGRAETIFGRERFRCSRCGSKASSYFNVDDLSDPRAVARLERIKKEQEEEPGGIDDEDRENEGDDDGEEDELPPVPPPRRPTKKL